MIEDQETIKNVKLLGLNTYEVKIWTALLSRGVSTAGELSDMANVPRSRSYDVLESLEKKGFVTIKLGKPIKYIAVPPKEALERVKRNIGKQAEDHILKITNKTFSNIINNLQNIHESTTEHKETIVAILKGTKNIQKHLEFLFRNAKNDILISTDKESDTYIGMLNNIKDKTKNVNIRIISRKKDFSLRENFDFKLQDVGVRLCIVDDTDTIIFPIAEGDTHPDYDFGVWIKDKQTARFLKNVLSSS